MACPRCGSDLYSDRMDERAYEYGGYADYDIFVGIEVYCSSRSCRFRVRYGIYELEDLALRDAEKED